MRRILSLSSFINYVFLFLVDKGGYFGELSIMKQCRRSTSAEAVTRCTLVALDKLEFLHMLNHSKPIDVSVDVAADTERKFSVPVSLPVLCHWRV